MGVLSYMAAGAASGFGQGMAAYGAQQARDIEREELLRQQHEDRMALQRERLALGSGGGGGGGGARGSSLADLLALDETQLTRARQIGGMAPERASELAALERGEVPTEGVALPATRFANPDRIVEAGGDTVQRVPKYAPGQADALAQSGFESLMRAVGLTKPEAADDIADAEATRQTAGLVKRYADGDERAGDAALVAQGKEPDAAQVKADAQVEAAKVRANAPKGGGGGSSGAASVQRTLVDSEGYAVAVFKDGTSRRIEVNGQPVKLNDFSRRVDALTKQLQAMPANFDRPLGELRAEAERTLTSGGSAAPSAARPPLSSFLKK